MDRLLCIWFGAGLLKPAPGTWGSAIALAMGVLLHRVGHFPLLACATLAVTLIGFWAVRRYTAGMSDPDRSEIVIDEVAGQWLALCFPSAAFYFSGMDAGVFPYPGWVAAFLFFRLFDIWKPWLVGRADREGGVDGVMKDDLWAGIFAGFATLLAAALAHLVLL
ncbi:phosphatidylglycerophosphatase A [Paracoccus sp. Z330]|uniref:Phosphatidylglycerophosphatase A n=1 Tax=Paracoccus onchidii TaxID=3017813 RepID=A0ABT4ZE30_9RHOB|nr:phosphatidylglycerophosphatase A [Paracoccus onchidii]MDB6176940.1 phosphatidylglycerophosphatase A [Paracoccus onchidii]